VTFLQPTDSHKPDGKLPSLSIKPTITSPNVHHKCHLASTKLYCYLSRNVCVCTTWPDAIRDEDTWVETHDLSIASPVP